MNSVESELKAPFERPDDDPEPDPADFPTLQAVAQLARMVPNVNWFSTVGDPLTPRLREVARDYLDALGFPHAGVAIVDNWIDAETAARNPDWNTDWWEAEEQLRAALTAEALEIIPEDELMLALTHVTNAASESVQQNAERAAAAGGVRDEALVRAAAGAATQACYHAALVLASGADDTHAFAVKYRLYEEGRWPLGVTGATFNLF